MRKGGTSLDHYETLHTINCRHLVSVTLKTKHNKRRIVHKKLGHVTLGFQDKLLPQSSQNRLHPGWCHTTQYIAAQHTGATPLLPVSRCRNTAAAAPPSGPFAFVAGIFRGGGGSAFAGKTRLLRCAAWQEGTKHAADFRKWSKERTMAPKPK